jgi:Retinal pigment epithelial membrane protein
MDLGFSSKMWFNLLIFDRFSSLFVWNWNGNLKLDRMISDNAMISVYPLGDNQLYAFAESPFIHRIDPVTLETTGRVNNGSFS